jgi:hypothetical protein
MVKAAAAGLTALLLTGCAQLPLPTIIYDKTANSVHSITLVTPYVSPQPTLIQGALNTVEDNPIVGGAVAALIIGGIEMDRQNKFNTMVQGQGFSAQDEVAAGITSALKAKNYTVTSVTAPRPDAKFLTTYQPAQADAYLDVVVENYGYNQPGITPFDPFLAAEYKLVRAKDNQVIMQGTVIYTGPIAAYEFQNYGAFGADPKRSVAGLKEETTEVATAITSGLP